MLVQSLLLWRGAAKGGRASTLERELLDPLNNTRKINQMERSRFTGWGSSSTLIKGKVIDLRKSSQFLQLREQKSRRWLFDWIYPSWKSWVLHHRSGPVQPAHMQKGNHGPQECIAQVYCSPFSLGQAMKTPEVI